MRAPVTERISRILSAVGQHQITPGSETLPSSPPLADSAQAAKAAATQAAWDQSGASPKRSRAPLIATGLGVSFVVLAGVAVFGYTRFVASEQTTSSAGPASQTAPVATADAPTAPTAPPPVMRRKDGMSVTRGVAPQARASITE